MTATLSADAKSAPSPLAIVADRCRICGETDNITAERLCRPCAEYDPQLHGCRACGDKDNGITSDGWCLACASYDDPMPAFAVSA